MYCYYYIAVSDYNTITHNMTYIILIHLLYCNIIVYLYNKILYYTILYYTIHYTIL